MTREIEFKVRTTLATILSSEAEDVFSWDWVLPAAERRRVGEPVDAVADMVSDLLRVSS
jgi:hypothetical protein